MHTSGSVTSLSLNLARIQPNKPRTYKPVPGQLPAGNHAPHDPLSDAQAGGAAATVIASMSAIPKACHKKGSAARAEGSPGNPDRRSIPRQA